MPGNPLEIQESLILVRGGGDWAPTDSEVDEHLARRWSDEVGQGQVHGGGTSGGPSPADKPSPTPPHDPEPRLWFPDQAHRDAVEAAAMEYMKRFYVEQDLVPLDVSDKNLGYDLRVEDGTGATVHLVEVKGTSMDAEGFFISRNERRCAHRESKWCLAVVMEALSSPTARVYSAPEMEERFGFEPLAWRCDIKHDGDAVDSVAH